MVLVVSWHGGGGGGGGGDGDAGGGDSATHWPQVSAQLVCIHVFWHLCACKRSFFWHQVVPLLSWHEGVLPASAADGSPNPLAVESMASWTSKRRARPELWRPDLSRDWTRRPGRQPV